MTTQIKITFLGTADSIPSARRNHPAILLSYEGENILFDCGEGTQRQFRKAKINPGKITRICISHWHGDHVLGIPGLLQTLALSGFHKKLFIYGPKGTKEFMREIFKVFNFKKKYDVHVEDVLGIFFETKDCYLEAKAMNHGIPTNAYSFVKKGLLRIDKKKLKKLKIESGVHLQDLKKGKDINYKGKKYLAKNLTFMEGDKKVSVVMDTVMNNSIVGFVKDADLFISESSFSSEDADKAKEHKHLTARQAGEIAKKAKVKKLVLTHISARYDKNPKAVLNDAKKVFKNSVIVQDLDEVDV